MLKGTFPTLTRRNKSSYQTKPIRHIYPQLQEISLWCRMFKHAGPYLSFGRKSTTSSIPQSSKSLTIHKRWVAASKIFDYNRCYQYTDQIRYLTIPGNCIPETFRGSETLLRTPTCHQSYQQKGIWRTHGRCILQTDCDFEWSSHQIPPLWLSSRVQQDEMATGFSLAWLFPPRSGITRVRQDLFSECEPMQNSRSN